MLPSIVNAPAGVNSGHKTRRTLATKSGNGRAITPLQLKNKALKAIWVEMGSVVIAYSGGVDSTFLAVSANNVLGDRALAVTASSPSLARSELDDAVSVARYLRLNHRVIETNEVEREEYRANDPNRCYFCKEELYSHLQPLAQAEGYAFVVNAHNADDAGDFRPGMNSAKRRDVRSPLVEAGLTKQEIRKLSREMALPTWDKPAQACLSSRIPYGTPVTVEALERISKAEDYLRSLGLRQMRVRHHDAVARIEVDADSLLFLVSDEVRMAITAYFKSIGYTYVTLDLEGFRSGSLNEVLASFRKGSQSSQEG